MYGIIQWRRRRAEGAAAENRSEELLTFLGGKKEEGEKCERARENMTLQCLTLYHSHIYIHTVT